MGQEIVYCFKCQNRLLGSDFEKGKAFRVGAQVACPDCVRTLLTHLPDPDAELERLKQQAVRKSSGGSSGRIPIVRSPSPDSSAKLRAIPRSALPPEPPASKSQTPLWIGAGVGGVVLLILLIAVMSGDSRPARTPGDNITVTGTHVPAPSDPTPAPSLPLEALKPFARELEEIDARLQPLLQRDQLREAALVLDAARRRHEKQEWLNGIDERLQKLDAAARRLAQPLIDQAVAAAKRRDGTQVRQLRDKVDALGIAAASEDFEKAVADAEPPPPPGTTPKPAPPKPKPKPVPPKTATPVDAYRGLWAKALGPASARDVAASLQQLQQVAATLKDAAAKKEAEADLADLKLAAEALAEVPKLLSRWSKGSKLKLEFIGESGTTELLEGTVLESGPKGVTVQTEGGVLDVPAGEIGAGSIGALLALRGEKRPTDARAAALLSALDGLAAPSLPDKWKTFKRTPDPAEAEVRRRFWATEEDFGAMKTRGAAGEAYAVLLEKQPTAAFVVRNKAFLEERLAASRDFLFLPEDLAGSGTFSLASSSKVESFWLSTVDSTAGKAAASALEAEFLVQAGATYRGWVYAGGCCQEVFTFFLQGSGLSGPSAKNPRETVTAEPGGEEWIAVKTPAGGLKKKHADHTGPKEPDRWSWVELGPLKFASPGMKKFRILTDQKGFSVAYLALSAVRQGAPREGELKDLQKNRPPPDLSPTGTILREIYKSIGGDQPVHLTGSVKFKEGKPDHSGLITLFDSSGLGTDYGCRIRGYVHPPASGDYVFWIASDDGGELWLSTDDTPAKKQRLCGLNHAVDQRKWDSDTPQQKSAPVALVAGKRYYIEALQKQGPGLEHLSVGWQLPGGALERPIPSPRLSPWGILLSRKTPRPQFRPVPPEGPLAKSALIGATGGTDFSDAPQPRMFLRGLKYDLSQSGCVNGLQALYVGASGESEGSRTGAGNPEKDLVAKPGYAVGGMVARGTDRLNAFKLIFMRISGSRLVASDRYESDWVGHRSGGSEVTLGGDGTPVLGVYGHSGSDIDGAGLLLLAPK